MATIVITTLVLTVLFNFFVLVFGTKDLEALKARIAHGDSYLKEVNKAIIESLGDKGSTVLKLFIALFAIVFLITHLITAILILVSIAVGTWGAKRLYKVGAVQNVLNRVATYVNRLR